VTNAKNQVTLASNYSCSGALGSVTDPNSRTTWTTYDLLGRTLEVHFADGGLTTHCYSDVVGSSCSGPSFKLVTTKTITTTPINQVTSTILFDGLGQAVQSQLTSDPQGVTYVDTVCDFVGRPSSVSTPYRSTSEPTYGVTTTQFDVLGRPT